MIMFGLWFVTIVLLAIGATSNADNNGQSQAELIRMNVSTRKVAYEKLLNYYNLEWTGTIYVGKPEQAFGVLFDTTRSDFWLRSIDCETQHCYNFRRYNRSASSTYHRDGREVIVKWEDGKISGMLSEETLQFADITVNNQTFLDVTDLVGLRFSQKRYDGIFGLGFSAATFPADYKSPLQNVFEQKLLPAQMFSIFMQRDLSKSPDGMIIFGGVDNNFFKGNITYAPVTHARRWQFKIDEVSMVGANHEQVVIVCEKGCQAQLDTSWPYLMGPIKDIEMLNGKINAKSRGPGRPYMMSCNLTGLPDLVFKIGGHDFVIKPNDYVKPNWLGIVECMSGLYPSSGNDLIWTLGAMFMGPNYTVFDYANQKVGFAESKN